MIEIIRPQSNIECQRLFHGRGHSYPGFEHISIDWFPPVVLITLYKQDQSFLEWSREKISQQIPFAFESIIVQHRWQKEAPMELLRGRIFETHVAVEDGLKYYLNFFKGQNYGFFMDMKYGRQLVRELSAGKSVLNLFSYTCSFSVAAMAGGATKVLNVDLSAPSLSVGRENHRINQQPLDNITFAKLNILKSFGRFVRNGLFDIVIIDPPTYQKNSFDVKKDYQKIIRRLGDFAAPGAKIIACLNSTGHDRSFLEQIFSEHLPMATLLDQKSSPEEYVEKDKRRSLKICLFELTQ